MPYAWKLYTTFNTIPLAPVFRNELKELFDFLLFFLQALCPHCRPMQLNTHPFTVPSGVSSGSGLAAVSL